jgi:hypothetical protein
MNPIDIPREIKRREKELYKRAFCFAVLPFAVELIAVAMDVPDILARAGFVAFFVGMIICLVSFYRLSRCPICNQWLGENLFVHPRVYQRCPMCHTPFTSSG